MKDIEIAALILENLNHAIVYADKRHVIRYMNAAGRKKYARFGEIIGKSLLDCHNELSRRLILDYIARMESGADEILEADKGTRRVYIRSVRGPSGALVGYYEIE